MPFARRHAFAFLLLAALRAHGDASGVTDHGFLVTHRLDVAAAPPAVFEALRRVDGWWNGEHTYSGNAANLALDPQAGGCLCERWNGNSIEHARVIYAHRDKVLRLEGALGPLQPMAVNGILEFRLAAAEGGTALTVTYRVRGIDGGLEKLAPVVDGVIGDQARRLAGYAGGK